jgi:hypothetical protein
MAALAAFFNGAQRLVKRRKQLVEQAIELSLNKSTLPVLSGRFDGF